MQSKIIITIDTEVGETAKNIDDGFEKFVLGQNEDKQWGVPFIIESCDKYGFKAEFFTDIYEYKKFGEEKFKNLCQYIDKKGHTVALHTHPSYAYDTNRRDMYEYSLEEQIQIIKEGKELIKKWTGTYPVSHRAGNYGANDDTLIALKENGIFIDSSFFYKHPNSKIQAPTINIPILYKDILQFPVTVAKKFPTKKGIPIPIRKKYYKLDINGMKQKDLENAIKELNGKVEYIILFLHSFSFVSANHHSGEIFGIDKKAIKNFENILKQINDLKLNTILFKDIIKC